MSLDCCPVMKLVSSSITSSVFQIMILSSYLYKKKKMITQTTTNCTAQPSKMVLWIFSSPFGFARGNVHGRARMRHIHWKNVHPHLQMALRNMQMDNYYNHSATLNCLYMHSKCIYSELRLHKPLTTHITWSIPGLSLR